MRRDWFKEWCPWRSWGRLCSTVLMRGDQHDKDRIAERTQREPGSRKGKVLNRAWGQPLKSWRRTDGAERGKMRLVKKQRRQLCGLDELERGGERRLHAYNERKMWISMFSLFCSQSAEKSILINSISNPWLREQQNYEGKRMPSDTSNQEK